MINLAIARSKAAPRKNPFAGESGGEHTETKETNGKGGHVFLNRILDFESKRNSSQSP